MRRAVKPLRPRPLPLPHQPLRTTSARRPGSQWARSVVGLVEEICLEQLPAAATERLRERREREQAERAQADAEDRAAQAAYTQLVGQFDTLGADQREAAIARYEQDHPAGDFLAEQLQTRHEELSAIAETQADLDASDSVAEQAA